VKVRIVTPLSVAEAESAIAAQLQPWLTHDYSAGAFVGRSKGGRVRLWYSKWRWLNLPGLVFSGRIQPHGSGAILEGRFELPRFSRGAFLAILAPWAFVSLRGIPTLLQGESDPWLTFAVLLAWGLLSLVLLAFVRATYRLFISLRESDRQLLQERLTTWLRGAAA
jgi:hypothetical protein